MYVFLLYIFTHSDFCASSNVEKKQRNTSVTYLVRMSQKMAVTLTRAFNKCSMFHFLN